MKQNICIVIFLLTVAGCTHPTDPAKDVAASVESNRLVVANNTGADVYYGIYERNSVAYTEWIAVCSDNNRIARNGKKYFPFNDSTYLPSDEAIVYWWHKGLKIEGTEAYAADRVRAIVLKVR